MVPLNKAETKRLDLEMTDLTNSRESVFLS